MAKWYDPYLTKTERANLQISTKGIRARNRKRQIENQKSLGNPKGLRDLEPQKVQKQSQTPTRNTLEEAFKAKKR